MVAAGPFDRVCSSLLCRGVVLGCDRMVGLSLLLLLPNASLQLVVELRKQELHGHTQNHSQRKGNVQRRQHAAMFVDAQQCSVFVTEQPCNVPLGETHPPSVEHQSVFVFLLVVHGEIYLSTLRDFHKE